VAGAVATITGVVDIGMVLRCDIDVFSVRYQGHLPHARTARRIPESSLEMWKWKKQRNRLPTSNYAVEVLLHALSKSKDSLYNSGSGNAC